jgi:uncharacterized membrane protein YqiK
MSHANQDEPLVNLKFDRPAPTLAKSASDALLSAKAYVIDSPEMYELAATELQQIKGLQKKVEAERTAITGPMNQALRAVNAFFKGPAGYLEQAESILKKSMSAYQVEQERLRIEEQRRLEAAAAAERARLAEEAAAAKAKADAEAEALRQQAAQAAASGDAEIAARLAAQAESRVEEGALTAQVMTQTSQLVSAPVAAAGARKVSGISTRENWTFEITDPALIPREYLMIDESKIRGVVRALKDATNIPGVRAYSEKSIAARAA